MARFQLDTILDQALNYIKTNGTKMCACSGQPATYNSAIAGGKFLAAVAIISTDYTGPADGDVSGRKLTINQQASVSVTTTGTGNHVAIVDTVASALLYVTVASAQALTAGNLVTFNAWDIEIEDAAAP